MSWTDDRVALLKKLWGEGKTAAEIAGELGGVTRNAVIGKAHRLKLSNRVSPIQQNKKQPAPANKSVAPEAQASKKVEAKVAAANMALSPSASAVGKKTVPLMDLKPSMCRWPIGDPQEENFGFCGGDIVTGLPYCSEHAKMAYQAATRNKVLKAEDFEDKPAKKTEAEEREEQEIKKSVAR